ncbi:hypothetical protein B0H15DRAFT_963799 [Mycena belliarum]|uniref:Uncharacterized protein n=1 Tax=Mycena belliarum TaxID=1033014 RepID=A0AAD6TN45_9AGAR|nr:hypothetical protein B0H15DRAFT_963799 [Mycena belliae]
MTASNAIARSCRRRRLTRIERARLMVLVTRPAAAQQLPRCTGHARRQRRGRGLVVATRMYEARPCIESAVHALPRTLHCPRVSPARTDALFSGLRHFVHRAYPEFACAASIRMAPHAHNFSVSRDPAGMPNRAHTGGVECVLQNGQHRRGERVEARGPGGELQVARAACTVFYDKLDSWPNILRHAKQQLEKDQNLRRKQQNPASVLIQQLIEFAMFVRDSTSGPRCNLEYACWPLAWMLAGNVEMPTSDDIIQVLIERAALRGEELPKEQLPSISGARVMQPLNAMFFTSPVALLANHHLAGAQPIPHILQATRWRAFGSADAPTLFKVENIIINGLFSMVFGGALAQDTLQNILSDPVIDEALSLEEASNEWTRFVLPPSPPLDGLTFSPASSPGPGGPVGSVEFMPIAYKEPSTTKGTNTPEHASSTSTSPSIIFTLPSTNVTTTEAVSTTKRKHAQLESAPLIEESSSEQFEPRKKNKNAITGAGVLALANPKRPKRPRPQVYDNKTSDSETENSSASELSSETETLGRIDEENKYIEIEMPLYSAKNVTSPPIHKYVYTSWSESAADGTRDPDIVQCKVPYESKIFERVNGTFEKAVQAGFAYGQSLAPGALSSASIPKTGGKYERIPDMEQSSAINTYWWNASWIQKILFLLS